MKISGLKLRVIENPQAEIISRGIKGGVTHDLVLLELSTEGNIKGYSFAWGGRGGKTTAEILVTHLKPLLINEDPWQRESLWQKFRHHDRWWTFAPLYVYGPIDVALWDIAGKVSNQPVYRLLGGFRDRLKVYASSLVHPAAQDFVREALFWKQRNVHAYKIHPWGDVDADIELCREVREAVGPELKLMLDPVGAYTREEALRVGKVLEDLDFYWFEEPVADHQIAVYRDLTRRLNIPIAGLEFVSAGLGIVAEYIRQGAVDIVRSDVSWKGGITGLKKTAALCEAFGLQCEVHTTTYGLLDLANLHVCCAISNCEFFELLVPHEPFGFGLKNPPLPDSDGYVHVPDSPGIGGEIDWDAIENHTILEI